jgi:hypothetical protein
MLFCFEAGRPELGHSPLAWQDPQARSTRRRGSSRRYGLLIPSLLLALSGLSIATNAQAYCRTRTCEFDRDMDCKEDAQTGCSSVGEFVKWGSGCISYAIQRDGSAREDISADELEALVNAGFQSWTDLSCGAGRSPALSAASQGKIACDGVEYDCKLGDANSNLIMFRDEFSSMDSGLRFGVIALTTITANLVTGELFDADIEINSRDEDFSVRAAGSTDPKQPLDLPGVVNHELGHLLGLSHSRESGALMRAAYEGTALPAADDRSGICAALGSSATDPECTVAELGLDAGCIGTDVSCTRARSVAEEPAGCSCRIPARAQPASSSVPWAWAGLLGVSLYRWQSRRRKTVL